MTDLIARLNTAEVTIADAITDPAFFCDNDQGVRDVLMLLREAATALAATEQARDRMSAALEAFLGGCISDDGTFIFCDGMGEAPLREHIEECLKNHGAEIDELDRLRAALAARTEGPTQAWILTYRRGPKNAERIEGIALTNEDATNWVRRNDEFGESRTSSPHKVIQCKPREAATSATERGKDQA